MLVTPHPATSQALDTQETRGKHVCREGTRTGNKQGGVKAALGESIHRRGTEERRLAVKRAGCRVRAEGCPFTSVSLKSAGLPVSPTRSFSPFSMEQEAPPGAGLGGLARWQVTGREQVKEALQSRAGTGPPRGASWRECTFSWWQRLAGASSLFPAPHTEAFPSLHEDLFTAPKTADTE